MKSSVIIPVYNEGTYIKECLESLLTQEEKADEIIVVNNNCTDNTLDIVRRYPVRIVEEKRQGMIFSRNKGFDSAKYQLILRTDADTRVPKDWVKRAKRRFQEDPLLIALSGPPRFYETPRYHNSNLEKFLVLFYAQTLKKILGHNCLFGPNMTLKKSVWEKIKKEVCIEDNIVHEDIDLSIHIAPYGKILFDSKLTVDVSFRRWRRIPPYFDYPYRYFRTILRHRLT